jgi:hypothetical protein
MSVHDSGPSLRMLPIGGSDSKTKAKWFASRWPEGGTSKHSNCRKLKIVSP